VPIGAVPPNQQGSPTASVTVEEFADFQCPTCGAKHPLMKEIISAYGPRIRFIFRNYPLNIPAHDKAYEAATAAEAAGLQGRFWDMQNLLFTNQSTWSGNNDYRKIWEGYAAQLGLDVERFKNDTAGLNAKQRVDLDLARGRALNVNSTPSVFVNGVLVPFEQMTTEGLRQIIDGELAKAKSAPQSNQSAPQSNSASKPDASVTENNSSNGKTK
jgi:protein-disulfide isomerase